MLALSYRLSTGAKPITSKYHKDQQMSHKHNIDYSVLADINRVIAPKPTDNLYTAIRLQSVCVLHTTIICTMFTYSIRCYLSCPKKGSPNW